MVKTYAFRLWFALYKDNLEENPKGKFSKISIEHFRAKYLRTD
jgi:hypothetical protein